MNHKVISIFSKRKINLYRLFVFCSMRHEQSIDLSVLTRCLVPATEVKDDDVKWDFDTLMKIVEKEGISGEF